MTEMALKSRMAVLVVAALLSVYPVSLWTGGAGHSGTTRSARRPSAVSGSSPGVFCAGQTVDGQLAAISAWKGYTRKDGTRKRYFYYACGTRRQKGKEASSYSRTPNAEKIEAEVWEAVKAVLLDPERLERGLDTYLEAKKEKAGGVPRGRHRRSRAASPRPTARELSTRTWRPTAS